MTNLIGALFGRSPIRPIEGHMARAQSCVALSGEFLEAGFQKDWQQAESIRQQIIAAKRDADEIKRDIRTHLPRSLFLPVARADLLELLRIQDRMTNRSREIADLILVRKMVLPQDLTGPVRDYFNVSLETSEQALKAVNELDELLETGFRGKEAAFVESLIAELDDMETRSEAAQIRLRTLLFQHEQTIPPVEVMFLYKLVELIGDIAVISHKVGGRLLQLMAH